MNASTRIRLAFAGLALLAGVASDKLVALLPWVLLVVVLDLGATWIVAGRGTRGTRADAYVLLTVGAAVSGIAYALTGLSAALLVLVPAFHGGLAFGRRAIAFVCGAAALAYLVVTVPTVGLAEVGHRGEGAWILGSVVLVLLGAMSRQMEQHDADVQAASAAEASMLLRRLRAVADELDTGFDAPSVGELVLGRLADALPSDRSAVLTYDAASTTILAMRGTNRLPWADPSDESSPLHPFCSGDGTGGRVSAYDSRGRRLHLLAQPLRGADDRPLGMLVADRLVEPFTEEELAAAAVVATGAGDLVEAAVLFGRLREGAVLEERNRLAREMHDGIAQELAVLAYQADAAHHAAVRGHGPSVEALDDLRDAIRGTVKGMRTHIADLRMLDRPGRSLGAIVSHSLQTFGTESGIRTHLVLSEHRSRFPADDEMQLHRLVTDFLEDARGAYGVTQVSVELTLAPPYARLEMSHNGSSGLTSRSFASSPFVRGGGRVLVTEAPVQVTALLGEGPEGPEPTDHAMGSRVSALPQGGSS